MHMNSNVFCLNSHAHLLGMILCNAICVGYTGKRVIPVILLLEAIKFHKALPVIARGDVASVMCLWFSFLYVTVSTLAMNPHHVLYAKQYMHIILPRYKT